MRVSGMSIKGELSASEDVNFDGTFEGTIDLPHHRFVAGKEAEVNATITAKEVTVDGRLEGYIAADVVDIGPTATVTANIISPKFVVEEGALVNGNVNTERARAAGTIARHRQKG